MRQMLEGNFLIIGTNPVCQESLLGELKYWDPKEVNKMTIAVPWFLPGITDKQRDLDWFYSMSYDATQMLIEAVSEVKDDKKELTRENVQSQFKSLKEIRGRTGNIRLGGKDQTSLSNDRIDAPYYLIQLNCQNNNCKWDIVN
jgi:ABC-type branched-subunit amino acid transport system substrate-binding protein